MAQSQINEQTTPQLGGSTKVSTPNRLLQALVTWIAWIVSRILILRLVLSFSEAYGDPYYYYRGVTGAEEGALKEYPAVGVWPVQLLQAVIGGNEHEFLAGFIGMCLLLDVLFMCLLLLSRTKGRYGAAWFWIFFGVAAMHILLLRLDIVPGILVGVMGFCMVRYPRVASALLAVATAMKLWPGVLAAGLVDHYRSRTTWMYVGTFLATLVGLCLIVISYGGVDRLVTPLTYQSDRGLQIESVMATPFMVLAAFDNQDRYSISYTQFKAFEIMGPGVDAAAGFTSFLMLITVAFGAGWALWRFFKGGWHAKSTVAWMITMIFALIVSNKVFSPQYIVWLGPIIAVALAFMSSRRIVAVIAVLTFVMAALGTFVFPYNYTFIVDMVDEAKPAIVALAIRNVLMVGTMVLSFIWLRQECLRAKN